MPTVLAPQEWATLPLVEQRAEFFHRWTVKEAYLKARGIGLSFPPEQIALTTSTGGMLRIDSVAGDAREGMRRALHTVVPDPGYAAALVSTGSPITVHTFTFAHHPVTSP